MLSVFPNLLDWWMMAPAILRLGIGATLIWQNYNRLKEKPLPALIQMIAGALLLIGLFTQPASATIAGFAIWHLYRGHERQFSILQLATALALLFLGPGFYAIDLPL